MTSATAIALLLVLAIAVLAIAFGSVLAFEGFLVRKDWRRFRREEEAKAKAIRDAIPPRRLPEPW